MAFFRSSGFRILLGAAGLIALMGAAGAIAFYAAFVRDLPDLHDVHDYRPALASRVFDRHGSPIGEFFTERRQLTPLDEIPEHVVRAFIASEDSAFFEHAGIDYVSILRAVWVNVRAGGEIKQGASTITQQMVKGLLLSPERKFRRKIREMILAHRIEERFSKEEILYLYLNQIYFGHGAYGIGEAARTYFGKAVGELDVSEAALLAGLPKAPSRYSPLSHPEAGERRRIYVLERMLTDHVIDRDAYDAAVDAPPILAEERDFADAGAAGYFTEEVRRRLFDELGGDAVLRGGVTIETTLDLDLQTAAVRAVQQGVGDLERRQGYRGPLRRVADTDIPAELQRLAEANGFTPPEDPGALEDAAVEESAAIDEVAAAEEEFQAVGEVAAAEEESAAVDEVAEAETPAGSLTADALYEGVVTEVDADAQIARVRFAPEIEAVVALEDVSWARPPDPKSAPRRVRSIATVFSEGDVARFRLRPPAEDAEDEETEGAGDDIRVVLYQEPIVQGALLSIDVASQEVLALVGGYDFEKSQFNRVTQARRQPGSAFKPLIYSAALSKGYTPASILFDRPVVYTDEESGFVWRPRNYKGSFYGPITLREALARSVNNATVHLFRDVGVDFVIDYVRQLGIESPLNRDLSLALGSSDLSLLELTRAYAVYAAGGRRVTPTFIRRVTDRNGEVLLENVPLGDLAPAEDGATAEVDVAAASEEMAEDGGAVADGEALDPDQIISPELAYLTTSLLRAVVEDPRGTGWRLKALGRPLAGKTGTTNDQADAWFLGFSPDIATGVWVGHDESRFLGWGETGSRAAAPIWVGYMGAALRDRPVNAFRVPDPIVYPIDFVTIDRKTGLLAGAGSTDVVREAFLPGTAPTERAEAARTTAEGRRLLRLDDF
jgi:penicillin-binding protein 1A